MREVGGKSPRCGCPEGRERMRRDAWGTAGISLLLEQSGERRDERAGGTACEESVLT